MKTTQELLSQSEAERLRHEKEDAERAALRVRLEALTVLMVLGMNAIVSSAYSRDFVMKPEDFPVVGMILDALDGRTR